MAKPLPIDEKLVKNLAMISCTMKEIAAVVGCSVDTLERRFADVIKEGQEQGKSSLRRWQWKLAEKGNLGMLIWLGKQHLGQRDIKEILPIQPDQIKDVNTVDEAVIEIKKLINERPKDP